MSHQTSNPTMTEITAADAFFGPYKPIFYEVWHTAMKRLNAMKGEFPDAMLFTKRSDSSLVSDFVSAEVTRALIQDPQVAFDYKYGRLRIIVGGQFQVRFKKFRAGRRPFYIPTQMAMDFFEPEQTQSMFEGMPDPLTKVVCGYTPDGLGGIKCLHLVCPIGKANYWEIEITKPGDAFAQIPVMPDTPKQRPGTSLQPKQTGKTADGGRVAEGGR